MNQYITKLQHYVRTTASYPPHTPFRNPPGDSPVCLFPQRIHFDGPANDWHRPSVRVRSTPARTALRKTCKQVANEVNKKVCQNNKLVACTRKGATMRTVKDNMPAIIPLAKFRKMFAQLPMARDDNWVGETGRLFVDVAMGLTPSEIIACMPKLEQLRSERHGLASTGKKRS